ncbi:hypothetical protein INP83_12705 [Mucilaginibacter sp. 21P]|uniref:hypothetical protein n=1 Tax=Mucilaginibacter sp. 21P TaxID=2778902 RepID=UPI001C598EBE|nr:hypothetical protein [Mucilaginibacter sp. 21P]QXV63959.1 hypothetical protein INP83_12705 [Mucilaginibacter sp. 21P]
MKKLIFLFPIAACLGSCFVMSPAPANDYFSKNTKDIRMNVSRHLQQVQYTYYPQELPVDSVLVLDPLTIQYFKLPLYAEGGYYLFYKDEPKKNIKYIAGVRSLVTRRYHNNSFVVDTLIIGKRK